MEVKSSGNSIYTISIAILDHSSFITLEEFDNLLRKMVEFRVNYDEKEYRSVTEESKEEGQWDRIEREEADHHGIAAFAEDWDEEDQAYEAEREARELEAILREDETREWQRRDIENQIAEARNRF